MPSLSNYKKMLGSHMNGEVRKMNADMIMENTFEEDLATQIMYFYDFYHDSYPTRLNNLNPSKDKNKIPCIAKFITNSTQTYSKDPVTYHLMFKPSQEMFVDYYQDYVNMYGSTFPVGLYVDIKDSDGQYNKWLVVDKANGNDPQFPTYELLRCDYVLQYMMEGKRNQISVVLQSQNS